ncbi:MAG: hypothetical protein KC636_30280, partial [Myxococcales bacterium]|nr:hypothetical protein [Myxococcales bacterium]
FSVRWDTCLVLAEPHDEVTFELASDDGSRLFVDGRRVIDNWGRHRMRREVEVVKLGPGVHHLRVDYFEHKSGAGITLAASLAGEVPASLPPALLRYPGDDMDPARPCAAITP